MNENVRRVDPKIQTQFCASLWNHQPGNNKFAAGKRSMLKLKQYNIT